jgi:hypothetical protein
MGYPDPLAAARQYPRKLLQLLACTLFLLVSCWQATNPTTPLLTRMQDAFTWFDALGFPDLTGREYVQVATGHWVQYADSPPENTHMRAFLIEDEGGEFTVLTVDLRTRTFVKTPLGTEEYERVGYQVLDLHNEVSAYLEALSQWREEDHDIFEKHNRRLVEQLGERSEIFVLARACAANGLDELAYDLYAFASFLPAYVTQQRLLQEIVDGEIAHATMWRNVLAFEDVSISRQELLERFEQFVEKFPRSEHAPRARETALTLRHMVEEDQAHTRQARPLEAMATDERIAELIFQLRDQNGHQRGQPGRCDIFDDERGESSPAHQLVEMDYAAIPQLITVLDDERFTRSVGYHRDFYFSHHVLRVGDAALAIIERIAGRGFYTRYTTNSEMVKDGESPSVKAEVEAWWREFQEKGERRMLREAVEAGDRNSPQQARLLVEKYPALALEAINQGLRNAEDWWVHSELVTAVAWLEGEDPIPLLLSVADSGPYLSSRVAAAVALHRRGRPEGVAAMVQEWLEPGRTDPDEFYPQAELVEFLATCGSLEAVQALGKDLHERPVDVRYEVISALRSDDCADAAQIPDSGCESPQVAAEVEELLIRALDDTEEYTIVLGWGDVSFYDPRLCDLAGYALSLRWPERYEFDPESSLVELDRQLVELKNVWREARGLAPLPLPEALRVLDEASHANTVQKVVVAPDSVELDGPLAERLEALKGKPLTSKGLVGLLLAVTEGLPPGATGIKIRADRAGDDTV